MNNKRWGFQRDRLPEPLDYYQGESLEKFKPNAGYTKAMACCPFHNDRNPSLAINLTTGSFKCFGCNTSGGDVLSFQMNRYLQDFKTAAQDLGAWAS